MRILYAAIDQSVPGTHGGSVHVESVAEGLAARGHDVHVLAAPGSGPFPDGRVTWHALTAPLGLRQLRLLRAGRVAEIARRLRPDAVIERYYNFGGEGLRAARAVDAVAVLEVNAPVIDYPGSPKQRLDRALLVEPFRRWRDWQCRLADLIVTPSPAIVPAFVDQSRIVQLEWGADTVRFRPNIPDAPPFDAPAGRIRTVFAGTFRRWHGAHHLVAALRILRQRGRQDVDAVMIGDGPELARVRADANGLSGVTFTGAIPHAQMPAALSAAHIGVAPFDASAHPALSIDFYWSPLKIFEYMAAGLPVVAPAIDRLRAIVRNGVDGILYEPGRLESLADAIDTLTDPATRKRLGDSARARVVDHFSWAAHCERLEAAITKAQIGRHHASPAAAARQA